MSSTRTLENEGKFNCQWTASVGLLKLGRFCWTSISPRERCGGGQVGWSPWEKGGGCRRRGERGREVGFPRWREVGKIGEYYATLRNILQLKKCKVAGGNRNRAETVIKRYERQSTSWNERQLGSMYVVFFWREGNWRNHALLKMIWACWRFTLWFRWNGFCSIVLGFSVLTRKMYSFAVKILQHISSTP